MASDKSEYPYTIARSTESVNSNATAALLASILAAGTLDELSNAEDFSGIERYIRNQGRCRVSTEPEGSEPSEKTTTGLLFWMYPTGLHGPFHKEKLADGKEEIELHGTLVAVERGVSLVAAMRLVRAQFLYQGIEHIHIAKDSALL